MKINKQHFEYIVTNEKRLRAIIRDKSDEALADGEKTFIVTLRNPDAGTLATINLVKEGDAVRYLLFDKEYYNNRDTYPLLKDALKLES